MHTHMYIYAYMCTLIYVFTGAHDFREEVTVTRRTERQCARCIYATYMYVYIYIYTYIYICIYTYTHTHIYIHIYLHTYIYTYIYKFTCTGAQSGR